MTLALFIKAIPLLDVAPNPILYPEMFPVIIFGN